MPTFVHLAPDKFATRIRRNGIRARKHWIALRPEPVGVRGVYCMPVIGNFFITHQWLREMKRTHFTLVVRIKNVLTPDQQAQLRKMMGRHPEKAPRAPGH